MAGTVEQKLAALGVVLHQAPTPVANYVGFVRTGNLLFVSGQVCNNPEGKLTTLDTYTAAVIVAPSLAIMQTPTNTLLAWPNPSTGFSLQETPDLNPANWTDSTGSPRLFGGQKQVMLTLTNGPRFFRLRHP